MASADNSGPYNTGRVPFVALHFWILRSLSPHVVRYNRVFRLLLMTHRAGTSLASVSRTIAHNAPAVDESPILHARYRALSAFRHDMQHCVGVLREFFSRQVSVPLAHIPARVPSCGSYERLRDGEPDS